LRFISDTCKQRITQACQASFHWQGRINKKHQAVRIPFRTPPDRRDNREVRIFGKEAVHPSNQALLRITQHHQDGLRILRHALKHLAEHVHPWGHQNRRRGTDCLDTLKLFCVRHRLVSRLQDGAIISGMDRVHELLNGRFRVDRWLNWSRGGGG
jgi:hypothetical protein